MVLRPPERLASPDRLGVPALPDQGPRQVEQGIVVNDLRLRNIDQTRQVRAVSRLARQLAPPVSFSASSRASRSVL